VTAESLEPPALSRKLAAEVLGTFVLVFLGCGAAMASGAASGNAPDLVGTALAFGLAVLVMAYAVGHISGGHFNPAVSVGAAVAGRIAWVDVLYYVIAQLVGAVLAALVLFGVFKGFEGFESEGHMGQNGFGDDGSGLALWAALLIEVIGTAIFLWVILAATDKRNKLIAGAAPVAIGLTLTGLHLVMIPLTGTSVNPARSLGPALFAGTDAIAQLWVFIVAPLLGAAIAGFTYMFLFGRDGMEVPGGGLNFGGQPQAPYGQPVWDPNSGQWVQPGQPGTPAGGWAPQTPQQLNPGVAGPPSQPGQPGQPGQPLPPQQQAPPPGQPGFPPAQPGVPPAGPAGGPPAGPPPQQAPGGWTPPADPGGTQVRPPDGPA